MPKQISLEERFYEKVNKTKDCWLWLSSVNAGYGTFSYKGENTKAHRVAWLINYGVIPDNLSVLHTCDNRSCVNLEHLYLGTQKENMQDRLIRNRNPKKMPHLEKPQVRMIKKLLLSGETLKNLARKFKVSISTVSAIKTGRTWNAV